jgi:hypothetical protein
MVRLGSKIKVKMSGQGDILYVRQNFVPAQCTVHYLGRKVLVAESLDI